PLEFSTMIPFDAPYLHLNIAPLLIDLIPTSFNGQQCAGGGNGTSFDGVTGDPNIMTVLGKSGAACPTIPSTGGSVSTTGFVAKCFRPNGLSPSGRASAGPSVPQISSTGLPPPGNAASATAMKTAPAGMPPLAALLLGANNSTWSGQNLPWELTPLNMPS